MSVSVSRSDGLTMLTLTSDPSSSCPPLCQLLGALCYSPGLCSKLYGLSPQRGGPQAALGALWIITGIMHIGLGTVVITNGFSYIYELTWMSGYCPIWLGVLSLFFGVWCILSERYPRRILVLLNGLLNLAGAALSIAGIVLYSCALRSNSYKYYNYCERPYWDRYRPSRRRHYNYYGWTTVAPTTIPTTPVPPEQERCEEAKSLMLMLSTSIIAVLIVLSVLNLCVALSSATLSFKALRGKNGSKGKATSQK